MNELVCSQKAGLRQYGRPTCMQCNKCALAWWPESVSCTQSF